MKLRTIAYAYDALSDEGIQRSMRNWFVTLPAASIAGLLQLCSQYGGERCETAPLDAWALDMSGRS